MASRIDVEDVDALHHAGSALIQTGRTEAVAFLIKDGRPRWRMWWLSSEEVTLQRGAYGEKQTFAPVKDWGAPPA